MINLLPGTGWVWGGGVPRPPMRRAEEEKSRGSRARSVRRLTMPWCARDCSKNVENHERRSRSIFNVVQLRPRASDPPRYADDGAGVANHVWSVEEIVALLG